MEAGFARLSSNAVANGSNGMSIWAARKAFENAKNQGRALVGIIDRAEVTARSLPRTWSHVSASFQAARRLDIRG